MLRRARWALGIAAALASILVEGAASAYCRSSVCQVEGVAQHGKVCVPAEPDDCGTVLQWRQPCIGFALQKDGSTQVPLGTVDTLVQQAFAAWTSADCGGGTPSIAVDDLGKVACDQIEYNQHAGNANVVIFRDEAWPHLDDGQGSTDTIALTTVTYDVQKGDIFDADVEVNGVQNTFTTTDASVDVDLLSVLTHEMGHFLGMAHSLVDGATMFPNYTEGSLDLRSLSDDDVQGICAAYPPDREATGRCDGLPRHGFSPECHGAQTEGHCAIAAGSRGDSGPGVAVAVVLVGLAARRRLRGRSAPRGS